MNLLLKCGNDARTTPAALECSAPSSPSQQPALAALVSTASAYRIPLSIGIVALAHVMLLITFFHSLSERTHYEFFPLIPVGAVFLALTRILRHGLGNLIGERGWLLPLATWILLASALAADSAWLGMIAFLTGTAAVIVGLGGWALLRLVFPAWCFLFVMVPPPFAADDRLIECLQSLTAALASSVLDLFGVYHHLLGNVVDIAGRRYFVAEACSGIHSLLATLACTLFYILWQQRHWLHASLLLVAAVGWVLFENVTRVAGVVLITNRLDVDVTGGWRHDLLSALLFCATLGLTWSADRLLLFFLKPVSPSPSTARNDMATTIGPRVVDWRRSWLNAAPCAAAFLVLAVAQFLILPPLTWDGAGQSSTAPLPAVAEDALPADIGSWHRGEYQVVHRERSDHMAESSQTWHYGCAERHLGCVVSLDSPYTNFHDLAICYRCIGWEVFEKTDVPTTGDPDCSWVQLRMRKRPGIEAIVLFSAFDRDGQPIPRPATERAGSFDRVQSRLAAFASLRLPDRPAPSPVINRPVFQVQLMLESPQPLDERSIAELRSLYGQSLNRLRQQFAR
jgi:exosortase